MKDYGSDSDEDPILKKFKKGKHPSNARNKYIPTSPKKIAQINPNAGYVANLAPARRQSDHGRNINMKQGQTQDYNS